MSQVLLTTSLDCTQLLVWTSSKVITVCDWQHVHSYNGLKVHSQAILVARPNIFERRICCAGTVFYGIYYASFYTQYVQMLAAYGLAAPTSEEILEISPSSFQGALAGDGSLSVPHAYALTSGLVEPLCSGAICQQSIYALAPNTPYQVCRLANSADLVFI